MNKQALLVTSKKGMIIAETIIKEMPDVTLHTKLTEEIFNEYQAILFIGAMGICVRTIAPFIKDKHTDPAVVCIDSTGKYAVSVLSGHVGGANELTKQVAHILGAEAVITTQSDNTNLWALDTIGNKFGWKTTSTNDSFNAPLTTFVNGEPTALLLDIRDEGTHYLERTKPEHVDIYYRLSDINLADYKLLLAVSPYIYPASHIETIYFHPAVLHVGIGCRKNCNPSGIGVYIDKVLAEKGIAKESIKTISSIDIKRDEPLLGELQNHWQVADSIIYTAEELKDIEVPNPSEKVKEVTSVYGVSESTAIKSAYHGALVVEKQKGVLSEGNDFTFALALDKRAIREGHIEIVGAGPGDPDLVSVRGREFLKIADLILYAGSLVPIELTYCAKQGAVVRSSASMDLEEQFAIMKEFYDKGLLVVRLHTGDPCIYGAIQEQMAFFDQYKMSYHITPGISSFLAAAAALRSQFTIPEKVQTIILTRGEGRTAMPEKEKLHLLARSQSTMCIFLSASIVDSVQRDLLEHYPPETPIAACYKLTWKDERIYRGELKNLAAIVKENNLTLTTMIVVGEAIDNRHGLSRLYANEFKHLYRK